MAMPLLFEDELGWATLPLVPEPADAGGETGDVVRSAEVKGFAVALAAAGVDDHFHTGIDEDFGSIREREKRIRSGDGTSEA